MDLRRYMLLSLSSGLGPELLHVFESYLYRDSISSNDDFKLERDDVNRHMKEFLNDYHFQIPYRALN